MKKIVHICNNYVASKVHMELISSISKKGHEQRIFIPIRSRLHENINIIKNDNIEFKYFKYFDYLRFLPILKIFTIFIGYLSFSGRSKQDYVIAHNFWTDGMVAYLNNIFFGVPFTLVIRNTDMNVFLPKLKHYHWLMKMMVEKSDGLIFINKIYMKKFSEKYPIIFSKSKKNTLIFNGVNSFWLRFPEKKERKNILIYVGGFNANKNIKSTLLASEIVLDKISDLELWLIGGSEQQFKELLNLNEIPAHVKILGEVNNKEDLKSLYLQSKVFVMPSFYETFGLVYIEALLQGCSVICTKGQGIDGLFNSEFIKSVDPNNINQIAFEIENLLLNFDSKIFDENFYSDLIDSFDWNKISSKYLELIK